MNGTVNKGFIQPWWKEHTQAQHEHWPQIHVQHHVIGSRLVTPSHVILSYTRQAVQSQREELRSRRTQSESYTCSTGQEWHTTSYTFSFKHCQTRISFMCLGDIMNTWIMILDIPRYAKCSCREDFHCKRVHIDTLAWSLLILFYFIYLIYYRFFFITEQCVTRFNHL